MIRVLLAGATGAIGRPLVRALVAAGHEVLGLSRGPASSDVLTGLGAEPVPADAMDRDRLLRAVAGRQADAVVHEATALRTSRPPPSGGCATTRPRRCASRAPPTSWPRPACSAPGGS